MKTERWFLFDCHGQAIGRPGGYATKRGADWAAEAKSSTVRAEIWRRYYAQEHTGNNLVWSAKLHEV